MDEKIIELTRLVRELEDDYFSDNHSKLDRKMLRIKFSELSEELGDFAKRPKPR